MNAKQRALLVSTFRNLRDLTLAIAALVGFTIYFTADFDYNVVERERELLTNLLIGLGAPTAVLWGVFQFAMKWFCAGDSEE